MSQPIPWYPFASDLRDCFEECNNDAQWNWLLCANEGVSLASSQFGLVPKGSVLSYQLRPLPAAPEEIFAEYPSLFDTPQPMYYTVLQKDELSIAVSNNFDLGTCIEIEAKTRAQSAS